MKILIFWLAFAAYGQDAASEKMAFEKVCGTCHKSSLASDLKTEDEWVETVATMVENGAKGSAEQFDAVMRYLARNVTRVNVNTATADQIAPVLDVSEAAAQAVVEYRVRVGKFGTIEELGKVPGVSAAKLRERQARIAFR